jgi:hypothetical protein
MLPASPHASTLHGLALGLVSLLLLALLGFVGFYQKQLIKQWGHDRWRKTHLLLTIAAVIIVFVHAAVDGTDFSWLRGG